MKKRVTLITGIAAIVILTTLISVFAINVFAKDKNIDRKDIQQGTTSDFDKAKEDAKKEEALKNPKDQHVSDPKSEAELDEEKKELDARFEEQKKKWIEEDKKAGEIVKKYLNKEVNTPTYDKYEDYKTMQIMIGLINDNPGLTEDELKTLKNYLDMRYSSIDDNEELKSSIMKILGRTY